MSEINAARRARTVAVAAALAFAMLGPASGAVAASNDGPLSEPGWHLVAHMSDTGGMFDGNGELAANYDHGTFVADPVASTADFQRTFPVPAGEILFITGDGTVWAITDYGDLRALIDARGVDFGTNLTFEVGVDGVVTTQQGNVLSRSFAAEDPWISIDGGHSDGLARGRIVWGENDWGFNPAHIALKNGHGGINVYVRAAGVATSKSDCKRGGWRYLTDGDLNPFKNQGDCVSYVATGGKNKGNG